MSTGILDPLIHDPGRLRIIATLAALPDGDTLSVARLRAMIGLPNGSPITHVRELSQAGYLRITKTGGGGTHATARPVSRYPQPPGWSAERSVSSAST
jgi:hypothetical protein